MQPALNLAECLPFILLVQDKLEHWEEGGRLPYSEEKLLPHEDSWWSHVRKLLTHEIRLSEPKSFDGADPRQSIKPLYLFVTAPCRPLKSQQKLQAPEVLRQATEELETPFCPTAVQFRVRTTLSRGRSHFRRPRLADNPKPALDRGNGATDARSDLLIGESLHLPYRDRAQLVVAELFQ